MKKIAFIATDWNNNEYRKNKNQYGGVAYYRIVKPMEALEGKYDITFFNADIQKRSEGKSTDEFYDELTREFDMIVVKQIDNAIAAQALIHWCGVNKCVLVQDFDDNMLVVRDDQPAYQSGYGLGGKNKAYAASMMSLADALIVSTKPIKDYFGKFIKTMFGEKKDIYIYPNYNDVNDWDHFQPKKDKNKIVIGWAGSVTHDADLKLIMPAVGRVLDKYDNVYLELLGGVMSGKIAYLLEDWSDKAKAKFNVLMGCSAWDKYPELMMSQKWDIGLAPLVDDEFNRGKSHIKWMEYAMAGIPCIASTVYPYFKDIGDNQTIKHHETGLLAKNADEWETYISYLVENPTERTRIAKNAYDYIKEKLQWKQHQESYIKIIDNIFKRHYKR